MSKLVKRIIALFVILFSIQNVSFCQKNTNDDLRMTVKIGEYEFTRKDPLSINQLAFQHYEKHGIIYYNCYNVYFEEASILQSHILENKSYYEDKLNCEIIGVEQGFGFKPFDNKTNVNLKLKYNDWEEEYTKELMLKEKEKQQEKQQVISKRLASLKIDNQ